jgi:hypothetical protein
MDWAQFAKDLKALAQRLSDDLSYFNSEDSQAQSDARHSFTGDNFEYFQNALESGAGEALELLDQFSRDRCDSNELVDFASRTLDELTDAEQAIVWTDTHWHDRYKSFVQALGELPKVVPSVKQGRRDFYVYVHRDRKGQVFYVGKGTGRRAWSKDRDVLWHRYIETRSGGEYSVEIVREGLLEREAEELESELITEHGEHLVNWDRPLPSIELVVADGQIIVKTPRDSGRKTDSAALERRNQMRDANLKFVQETRLVEENNSERAVSQYRKAFETMREYESIVYEHGLVADLTAELLDDKVGDPVILDRITLCLKKLHCPEEMIAESDRYFSEFPGAKSTSIGKRILKRVERARKIIC